MAIRYLTSGESHGRALIGILEGIPSGLPVSSGDIDSDLRRRQGGHGRGGRMKIETDCAQVLSGVRFGKTIGSPIALLIENKDWQNWHDIMSAELKVKGSDLKTVTSPRPGHADLAGAVKYDTHDMRNILERSSARETAMRAALGAIAKRFLSEFGIKIGSYVIQIGNIKMHDTGCTIQDERYKIKEKKIMHHASCIMHHTLFQNAEASPVRCPDKISSKRWFN